MKITALFFGLILISANANAQVRVKPQQSSQPPDDNTPALKPGKVEGTVVSSLGGTPVKKATVTLRNLSQHFGYAATSDATGHFEIGNVQPGTYQVAADSSGFMASTGRASVMKPITVSEEQEVKDVAVKLTPLGSISGRVLDAEGEPIARASVMPMRYFYQQGRKQLQPAGGSNTNDLGEYQMIDLQPGRYYLKVSAQPRISRLPARTRLAAPETAYPATYYPSGADVAQAKATQVDPGSHIGDVDFRINEVPSHHVRGKVMDSNTGRPIPNAFVLALPASDETGGFNRNSAQVQPDGTFDMRSLVSGSYNFALQSQESPGVTSTAMVTVADRDVDGIVLQPDRGRDISGSVSVEGPMPDSFQGVRISLFPHLRMSPHPNAVIDRDGGFSLHDVLSLRYTLNVQAGIPGKYVKAIRFGDREITDGQLDFSQQVEGKLQIVLGSDVGQLLGGVQTSTGDPAVGALITLASKQEGRVDLFKVDGVDKNGNFTFKDIAPGEYMAFAWQDVDVNMVQSPEFRKPFESKGVSVSIAPSGQVSIQLKMISTEDVEAEKSKLP